MYEALGIGWATSLLGVFVCGHAADSVFLFSVWGEDKGEEWHGCEVRGERDG